MTNLVPDDKSRIRRQSLSQMRNLVSDDKSTKIVSKNTKNEKCHETDKNPTKSDENWSIWSQTGQGNLFRGVPDQKKIKKRSNFGLSGSWGQVWHYGFPTPLTQMGQKDTFPYPPGLSVPPASHGSSGPKVPKNVLLPWP